MLPSQEVAAALLESLLTRMESRTTAGAIDIEISRLEIQALRVLLHPGSTELPVAALPANTATLQNGIEAFAKPNIDWQTYSSTPIETHRLCIDFGTAFSKVCLIGDEDRFVKPLAIGDRAGYEKPLMVPSSVLVQDGRLYFGQDAIVRSRTSKIRHRRIDALKQFLSKGEIVDIDSQTLEEEYTDGTPWLTKGAVLRLYCAYLSALAEAAAEDLGFDPATLARRFARPAWDKDRSSVAEQFMQRMLSDCRVIAQELRGRWSKGIELGRAKVLLQAVSERPADSYTQGLVLNSVLEATAAANAVTGGFEDFTGRRLLAVVDVGAGTTDFGMFVLKSNTGDIDEGLSVWELTKGSRVLRQAGDTLDDVLASMLRHRLSAPTGTDIERRANAKIQNERRFLKEELFATGRATHRTDEDQEISVTLDEFNAHPDIKSFADELQKKFDETLNSVTAGSVAASGDCVLVVLTGGGSGLPMVRALLAPKAGRHKCKEQTVSRDDLLALDPRLPDVFPQLAVALGGAMERLPEQRENIDDLAAGARRTVQWRSFT